jgi:beta-phosphoglucomutase
MKDIAVIFDMDGVLVDNAQFHNQAWMQFCKSKGADVTLERVSSHFGNNNREYLTSLIDPNLTDEQILAYAIEKEQLYRDIFETHITAPEGLVEFLDELRANNIKISVGTSAPRANVDFVLSRLNIAKYFDLIVDETYVKHGKPNPEVYNISAEMLKLPAANCLVIEDSIHGIEAAKSAGMKVVGIASTHPASMLTHTDYTIKSFKEIYLKKVLEILNK